MIDPNFDPLAQLEHLDEKVKALQEMVNYLVESHNKNITVLKQMVEQINQHTGAINAHDLQINDIHNRLRLIEVARQYENNNQDHNIVQTIDHN
jgi:hypothetical protein